MASTEEFFPTEIHTSSSNEVPTAFEKKSIWDPASRQKAAKLVENGHPIGVYNRGVCAIWGNGEDTRFVEKVSDIKGEQRKNRPLASTLPTKEVVEIIDSTKIPSKLLPIFSQAEELTARLGSLCFLRLPITDEAAAHLPQSMVTYLDDKTPVIQNWDARGHKPTQLLLDKIQEQGVRFPAVTSMNVSGEPEIVDQSDGIAFSKEKGIPLFLSDPKDAGSVKGSYTIFNLDEDGVHLVRDGNIPGHLFAQLLGINIDETEKSQSKYPQLEFPSSLTEGMSPSDARIAILSYVGGGKEEKIHKALGTLKAIKGQK